MAQFFSRFFRDKRAQVFLGICVFSGVVWLFYDVEDDDVSFSQYREMLGPMGKGATGVTKATGTPVRDQGEHKKQVKAQNVIAAESHLKLEEAIGLAQEANKRCILAFRKLLPNKKWPEPFGPAYHQIADLKALLNVGLGPSLAKEDHQVILAMGAELADISANEHPMEVERVQNLLRIFWELESCRGRDLATLLDAILELARKNKTMKKYQDAEARALVAQLWRALVSAQKTHYTPGDLTFLIGFWQKVQAQGLIGTAHRGDLIALVEKIMNELHEEEARFPGPGIPLTSEKFLEFYREVQALGHELEEFGKEVLLSEVP
ncbi:MAG: hypothetical protein AABY86_17990 [Bdellovibrionota bacterium]